MPSGTAKKERTCGGGVSPPPMRKSRRGPIRAWVLIGVHLVFALHLWHWFATGRTLSPVEPSESMYFIEKGELNAGFIFFVTTIVLTAIFGRFFCGWGCHVVALQDFCAWIMKRLGVRPKLFRSRLLMYVPLYIGLEMFVWPTFENRVLEPMISDLEVRAWFGLAPVGPWTMSNHIITEGFWDTFAGPIMAIPFLGICGFAVVYFMGAKGFCTYGCPYGAFFAGADRLAPGKIVANLDSCEKCGHCTATCTSNVRIHEEIQVWGKVMSPGCMKCLDCVDVCPTNSLKFGWTRPKLLTAAIPGAPRRRRRYDLSLAEEIGLFVFFFATRWAWRSVYHAIPMLMATGIAGCLTVLAWKSLRTLRDREVSFHRFALKREGRLRPAGAVLLAVTGLLVLLTGLLGVGKWHQEQGEWMFDRLQVRHVNLDGALVPGFPPVPPELQAIARAGARHYERLLPIREGGIALVAQPPELAPWQRLGFFHSFAGDYPAARTAWERALGETPVENRDEELELRLAQVFVRLSFEALVDGSIDDAIPVVEEGLTVLPRSAYLARALAELHAGADRPEEAARWQRRAEEYRNPPPEDD